jgi:hypothetical protein
MRVGRIFNTQHSTLNVELTTLRSAEHCSASWAHESQTDQCSALRFMKGGTV